MIGYGLARILLEGFRQADAQFVSPANPHGHVLRFGAEWGLTMGQLLSLPMLAGRPRPGPAGGAAGVTALEPLIRARIEAGGPMRLDAWMALCLSHPEHGYYATRDPLGAAGDFVTAPEISQMFGELIGAWAARVWADQGRARPLRAGRARTRARHADARRPARRHAAAGLRRGRPALVGRDQPRAPRRPGREPGRAPAAMGRRRRRLARRPADRPGQRVLRRPAAAPVPARRRVLARAPGRSRRRPARLHLGPAAARPGARGAVPAARRRRGRRGRAGGRGDRGEPRPAHRRPTAARRSSSTTAPGTAAATPCRPCAATPRPTRSPSREPPT